MNMIKNVLVVYLIMLKTKQITVSSAVEEELIKIPKWNVLMYLQTNGETSVYFLSKELNWDTSKTHAVVNQLEKSNAIKSQIKIVNGRAVKFISLLE